ncbi:MAG: MgtC/SapB family protein [Bacteriovoracaceae bacterium]|nr:MgtC/SapB family protein [Bacteriovoracaceae bacterium]
MDIFSGQTIRIEFLGNVNLYFGLGFKIMTALLCGAAIGINREMKLKSAGFKTHIFICLGAALYTSVSMLNIDFAAPNVDPNRVAAQVVSGIGFLGAGAIFRTSGSTHGLTTAAGMWVVGAIGVAIGSGYPFTAGLFTLTILIVLIILDPFYRFIRPHSNIILNVCGGKAMRKEVIEFIQDNNVQVVDVEVKKEDADSINIEVCMISGARELKLLIQKLKGFDHVDKITHKSVINFPEHVRNVIHHS